MTEKLMSAYIDADDDVVALTKTGCYIYKHKLKDPKKLLKKLETAEEINTDHWNKEWDMQKGSDLK